MPNELLLLRKIERYGVQAVMGRPVLGAKEMRRMELAENVVLAYRQRAAAADWAGWARENPGAADLLNEAQEAVKRGK